MKVKCTSHPQLHVYDLKVRFENGEADVSEKTAEALRNLRGFCFDFPEAPADKPLDKMNKAEMSAKAAELGVTVPDKATNAEIIALIKGKTDESGQ